MKKIFTFLAMMTLAISLNAKTIYLNTGGSKYWNQDGAVFFIHAWGGAADCDTIMTVEQGDVFKADIPDDKEYLLFVRMPAGATAIVWDGDKKYWNKTQDLTIPTDKDCYTITGWKENEGEWSVYTPGSGPTPPTPTPGGEKDYFLKGWSGKDIETPTADEQFEHGILPYTVVSDETHGNMGYFFILICDKGQVVGEQYMAAQFTSESHATMVKTGGEKMGVPAGEVTFYLYDNEDGTYELSTAPIAGKKLVDADETALETVINTLDVNAPMFNVIGQPVDENYHGVVIQNGRKYIR